MKRYFEWPVDSQMMETLDGFYDSTTIQQHSRVLQRHKSELKIQHIKQITSFSATDTVLDIGCSNGIQLEMLADQISSGLGIDISETAISNAQKNKQHPNLTFAHFDGETLPSATQQVFSKILMIDVLEHVLDPDRLVRSSIDQLAPRGQLIIQVPFTGWLSELVTKKYHQGHLRYYDPAYLTQYLNRFGLTVVASSVYNTVPMSFWLLRRARLLWRLLNGVCALIPPRYYPYFGEILMVTEKK
jgi:SAM-dependent methyltransferase